MLVMLVQQILCENLFLFVGLIPASSYGKVLERIASHGYVVLGIWTLTALPMSQIHPQWLKDIDFWLQVFKHAGLI